jgi:hypothetical protein
MDPNNNPLVEQGGAALPQAAVLAQAAAPAEAAGYVLPDTDAERAPMFHLLTHVVPQV